MNSVATIPGGYKQTEVGIVPQDWGIGPLSKFWNVTDCKHLTAVFINSGLPLASIKEVQSRFIDLSNAKQTTQQFYNLLLEGNRKPKPGDLILSRNATVGEVSQVAEWHPPFAMGQDVCLLRKKGVDHSTDYLQSLFKSYLLLGQIRDSMVGSTFKRINVKQIKEYIIPMPSREEQEAIAGALSDADALIESLEKLISKKRLIKQGTMQELLTGKKRLPGFSEEKSGYKQTEVGMIPEDWSCSSIGNHITFQGGSQPDKSYFSHNKSDGFVRLIQIRDYKTDKYTIYVPKHLVRRFCSADDIMIGRYGPPVFQILKGLEGAYNVALIKAEPSNLNKIFAYYILKQEKLFHFIDKLSRRSSGQTGVDLSELKAYPLLLPPTIEEQEAIAEILSDIDEEISELESKLHKARQIKQGMMQELLTGKTRLV